MENKIQYIDYEKMRAKGKEDWRCPQIPDGFIDKLLIDKDLFFALFLNLSINVSDKLHKPLGEITFVDIANYLYDKNNLSDIVSMVRFRNMKEEN